MKKKQTSVTAFFSKLTKRLIHLKKKVLLPSKQFSFFVLPKRMNNYKLLELVQDFRSHDDVAYLLTVFPIFLMESESYLIYHLSKNGDKCVTFLVWDDNKWHVSTMLPEFNPESFPGWNEGIILLH